MEQERRARRRRGTAQTEAAAADTEKKRKPKRERGLWGKTLLLLATILCLLAAAGAVTGAIVVYQMSQGLPSDEEILSYKANEASALYDRKGRLITTLYIEDRQPVKLKSVSRWMVMSILAAEDSDFYSHCGIRPLAILRSLITGEGGQGASTITQQLARNLFLSREKTMSRKIKEAILTLRMEKLYTKDTLLETYLNAIYFGHGAWGIAAAARIYFGTTADALTLNEASVLAGLVAAPERYSPIRNMELARQRQAYVLGRMVSLGWITPGQAQATAGEPLKLATIKPRPSGEPIYAEAPYFVSQVLFGDLLPKYGADKVYKGGMRISTTLDLDVQRAAEEAMSKMKSEGALVALDPRTGAVLALVGGKDFGTSKFNRATQAYRLCGSAFKPVVYAAALEEGYRPNDHIMDAPITLNVPNSPTPVWSPQNFSHKYAGEEPLFSALVHSHNTPAVRLTILTGVRQVVDLARRMGITSPYLTPTLSVGLGVSAVTPLEMATAYSTFDNDGARVTPYFVSDVRSSDGQILFSALPKQEQAMPPAIAEMTRAMLQNVMIFGTGAGGRIPGWTSYGKTGTTNEYTDAWFCGGVPDLVCVVYAGNDNYKPLGHNATGARIALPIWSDFMKQAVKILQLPKDFPPPVAGLKAVALCRDTGFLATAQSPARVTLLMPADKIPTIACPLHGGDPASAAADPNAPRLLLLPQDQADLATVLPARPVQPQQVTPDQNQMKQDETLPVTTPMPALPTPKSIDERYDELLRQYGIKP